MKNFVFVFILIAFPFLSFSQIGIYRTYEDFLNDKMEKYDKYHSTSQLMGKFKVVFIDQDDKKVKLNVNENEMWGYRKNDEILFRVDKKNAPYAVIIAGKLVVYGNFSTEISEGKVSMRVNQFPPQVSYGLNGEMMELKKNNLKKILRNDPAALDKLNKTKGHTQALFTFVENYNQE